MNWRAIGLVGTVVLVGACSRDGEDAKPRVVSLTPTFYLDAGPATAAAGAQTTPPDQGWHEQVDAAMFRPRPVEVTVSRTVTAGAAAAASARRVNPDDAVLERARVAAGGCFRSLAADVPRRSAHIVFTVIPTGTVSRADVSSPDTTNDGVLDCIHQEAMSTVFSDNADGPLRTYAIDVQVTAGGR